MIKRNSKEIWREVVLKPRCGMVRYLVVLLTVCVVELGLWRYYAQTKRTRHRPWCEDGAYALGLGVLMPHTMVGAKAAPHHGCGEK
jgi:hypothetical protein